MLHQDQFLSLKQKSQLKKYYQHDLLHSDNTGQCIII